MSVKTVPISPDIHKLLKFAALNYGVSIQDAATRMILAGAKTLNIAVPETKVSKDDAFWQFAQLAAEDMDKHQTNDMETIEATVQKVRAQRAGKKKTK